MCLLSIVPAAAPLAAAPPAALAGVEPADATFAETYDGFRDRVGLARANVLDTPTGRGEAPQAADSATAPSVRAAFDSDELRAQLVGGEAPLPQPPFALAPPLPGLPVAAASPRLPSTAAVEAWSAPLTLPDEAPGAGRAAATVPLALDARIEEADLAALSPVGTDRTPGPTFAPPALSAAPFPPAPSLPQAAGRRAVDASVAPPAPLALPEVSRRGAEAPLAAATAPAPRGARPALVPLAAAEPVPAGWRPGGPDGLAPPGRLPAFAPGPAVLEEFLPPLPPLPDEVPDLPALDYVVHTQEPGGPVRDTFALIGIPQPVDVDANPLTGTAGAELTVHLHPLSLNAVRLAIDRATVAPLAVRVWITVQIPEDPTAPPSPETAWAEVGYDSLGLEAPTAFEAEFATDLVGGTTHRYAIGLSTTGAASPFGLVAAYRVVEDETTTALKEFGVTFAPPPARIDTVVTVADDAATSAFGLAWSATSATALAVAYHEAEGDVDDDHAVVVRDLPATFSLSATTDKATATTNVVYDAVAAVAEARYQGLFRRAGSLVAILEAEVLDMPTHVAARVSGESGVHLEASSPIGRLSVLRSNAPAPAFPDDVDHVWLHAVGGLEFVRARLSSVSVLDVTRDASGIAGAVTLGERRELHVRADLGADAFSVVVQDLPTSFTFASDLASRFAFTGSERIPRVALAAALADLAADVEILDVPRAVSLALDVAAGSFRFTVDEPLGAVLADVRDPTGLGGSAFTELRLEVRDVPSFTLGWAADGSRVALDVPDGDIGVLAVAVATNGLVAVPGYHLASHRDAVTTSVSLRLARVEEASAELVEGNLTATLDLAAPLPLLVAWRDGTDSATVSIEDLPDRVEIATDLATRLGYVASQPIARLAGEAEVGGIAFAFLVEGVPDRLDVTFDAALGRAAFVPSSPVGHVRLDAHDPDGLLGTEYRYASLDVAGLAAFAAEWSATRYVLDVGAPGFADAADAIGALRLGLSTDPVVLPSAPGSVVVDTPSATTVALAIDGLRYASFDVTGGALDARLALAQAQPVVLLYEAGADSLLVTVADVPASVHVASDLVADFLYEASAPIALAEIAGTFAGTTLLLRAESVPDLVRFDGDLAAGRGTFTTSATIGRILVSAANPAGLAGTPYTDALLDVAGLGSFAAAWRPDFTAFTLDVGAPGPGDAATIGSLAFGIATGPIWTQPEEGAAIALAGDRQSLYARLTGLRYASADLASGIDARLVVDGPRPVTLRYLDDAAAATVVLADLPGDVRVASDLASFLSYEASEPIALVTAEGVFLDHAFRALAEDVPSSFVLRFALTDGAGAVSTTVRLPHVRVEVARDAGLGGSPFRQAFLDVVDLEPFTVAWDAAGPSVAFDSGAPGPGVGPALGSLSFGASTGALFAPASPGALLVREGGTLALGARLDGLLFASASMAGGRFDGRLVVERQQVLEIAYLGGADFARAVVDSLPRDVHVASDLATSILYEASDPIARVEVVGLVAGHSFRALLDRVAATTISATFDVAAGRASLLSPRTVGRLLLEVRNDAGLAGTAFTQAFADVRDISPFTVAWSTAGPSLAFRALPDASGATGIASLEVGVATGAIATQTEPGALVVLPPGGGAPTSLYGRVLDLVAVTADFTDRNLRLATELGSSYAMTFRLLVGAESLTAVVENVPRILAITTDLQSTLLYEASERIARLTIVGTLLGHTFLGLVEGIPTRIELRLDPVSKSGRLTTDGPLDLVRFEASRAAGLLGTPFRNARLHLVSVQPFTAQWDVAGRSVAFDSGEAGPAAGPGMGYAFLGVSTGAILTQAEDGVVFHDVDGLTSISASVHGLRYVSASFVGSEVSARIDLDAPLLVRLSYASGADWAVAVVDRVPTTVVLESDLRTRVLVETSVPIALVTAQGVVSGSSFLARIEATPSRVEAVYDPAGGFGRVATQGTIGRVYAYAENPAGLGGSAFRRAELDVRVLPAFEAAFAFGANTISASFEAAAPMQSALVRAASGAFPSAAPDHLIVIDSVAERAFSAKITGLVSASAHVVRADGLSARGSYTLAAATPFLVRATKDANVIAADILDLPAQAEVTLDASSAGFTADYRASSVIGRVLAAASVATASGPVHVVADVRGVPTVMHAEARREPMSATFQANAGVGRITLAAYSFGARALAAGEQGFFYRDGADWSAFLDVVGVSSARAGFDGTRLDAAVTLSPGGQPFSVGYVDVPGDVDIAAWISNLPSTIRATVLMAPPNAPTVFDATYEASAPIAEIVAAGRAKGVEFVAQVEDLPSRVVAHLDLGSMSARVDTDAEVGAVRALATLPSGTVPALDIRVVWFEMLGISTTVTASLKTSPGDVAARVDAWPGDVDVVSFFASTILQLPYLLGPNYAGVEIAGQDVTVHGSIDALQSVDLRVVGEELLESVVRADVAFTARQPFTAIAIWDGNFVVAKIEDVPTALHLDLALPTTFSYAAPETIDRIFTFGRFGTMEFASEIHDVPTQVVLIADMAEQLLVLEPVGTVGSVDAFVRDPDGLLSTAVGTFQLAFLSAREVPGLRMEWGLEPPSILLDAPLAVTEAFAAASTHPSVAFGAAETALWYEVDGDISVSAHVHGVRHVEATFDMPEITFDASLAEEDPYAFRFIQDLDYDVTALLDSVPERATGRLNLEGPIEVEVEVVPAIKEIVAFGFAKLFGKRDHVFVSRVQDVPPTFRGRFDVESGNYEAEGSGAVGGAMAFVGHPVAIGDLPWNVAAASVTQVPSTGTAHVELTEDDWLLEIDLADAAVGAAAVALCKGGPTITVTRVPPTPFDAAVPPAPGAGAFGLAAADAELPGPDAAAQLVPLPSSAGLGMFPELQPFPRVGLGVQSSAPLAGLGAICGAVVSNIVAADPSNPAWLNPLGNFAVYQDLPARGADPQRQTIAGGFRGIRSASFEAHKLKEVGANGFGIDRSIHATVSASEQGPLNAYFEVEKLRAVAHVSNVVAQTTVDWDGFSHAEYTASSAIDRLLLRADIVTADAPPIGADLSKVRAQGGLDVRGVPTHLELTYDVPSSTFVVDVDDTVQSMTATLDGLNGIQFGADAADGHATAAEAEAPRTVTLEATLAEGLQAFTGIVSSVNRWYPPCESAFKTGTITGSPFEDFGCFGMGLKGGLNAWGAVGKFEGIETVSLDADLGDLQRYSFEVERDAARPMHATVSLKRGTTATFDDSWFTARIENVPSRVALKLELPTETSQNAETRLAIDMSEEIAKVRGVGIWHDVELYFQAEGLPAAAAVSLRAVEGEGGVSSGALDLVLSDVVDRIMLYAEHAQPEGVLFGGGAGRGFTDAWIEVKDAGSGTIAWALAPDGLSLTASLAREVTSVKAGLCEEWCLVPGAGVDGAAVAWFDDTRWTARSDGERAMRSVVLDMEMAFRSISVDVASFTFEDMIATASIDAQTDKRVALTTIVQLPGSAPDQRWVFAETFVDGLPRIDEVGFNMVADTFTWRAATTTEVETHAVFEIGGGHTVAADLLLEDIPASVDVDWTAPEIGLTMSGPLGRIELSVFGIPTAGGGGGPAVCGMTGGGGSFLDVFNGEDIFVRFAMVEVAESIHLDWGNDCGFTWEGTPNSNLYLYVDNAAREGWTLVHDRDAAWFAAQPTDRVDVWLSDTFVQFHVVLTGIESVDAGQYPEGIYLHVDKAGGKGLSGLLYFYDTILASYSIATLPSSVSMFGNFSKEGTIWYSATGDLGAVHMSGKYLPLDIASFALDVTSFPSWAYLIWDMKLVGGYFIFRSDEAIVASASVTFVDTVTFWAGLDSGTETNAFWTLAGTGYLDFLTTVSLSGGISFPGGYSISISGVTGDLIARWSTSFSTDPPFIPYLTFSGSITGSVCATVPVGEYIASGCT